MRVRSSSEPPAEGIFPMELTWLLTPFPKTLSDESINWGLVCPCMHSITQLKRFWHWCPWQVNASNTFTPSRHHSTSSRHRPWSFVLFVGCLSSQQHVSVSQGRICTDNFTCCHTEIEAADQTFHLTQSQYTDTGPTSPSADPITPGA